MTETPPQDEAPDGVESLEAATERAERMTLQRREIGTKYDASLAKISELEKQLEAASKPAEVPAAIAAPSDDGDGPPAWAKGFMAGITEQVSGLKAEFTEHRTRDAYAGVEAKVLASVPDGNKETARALLGSLGVDFNQPTAAADALAKLQANHSVVMFDASRGPQPRAPQTRPDGSLDFSQFKHPSEIPPEFVEAAAQDPEVMKRLLGSVGQGTSRETDGATI